MGEVGSLQVLVSGLYVKASVILIRLWNPEAPNPHSVDHPLRRNYASTESDSKTITHLLTEAERELSGLETEITKTQDQTILEQLHSQRSEQLRRIDEDRTTLSSPIRHLPAEILAYIFVCGLDWDSSGFIRSPSMHSAPLLLCRVCSLWRNVAMNTPELWAGINGLDFRGKTTSKLLIRIWLERAKLCPLDLHIDSRRFPEAQEDMVVFLAEIFVSRSSTIRSLRLKFMDPLLHMLSRTLSSPVPLLEELRLMLSASDPDPDSDVAERAEFTTPGQRSLRRVFDTFQVCHRLRYVSLYYHRYDLRTFHFPWGQLTSLCMNKHGLVGFWELRDILEQCKRLEYLRIEGPSNIVTEDDTETQTIVLPFLQTLHLTMSGSLNDVLDMLSLPSLTNLHIIGPLRVSVFLSLASRSSFHLKSLEWSIYLGPVHPLDIQELFRTTPSLHTLSVLCRGAANYEIFKCLEYSSEDTDPLLPCLRNLAIDFSESAFSRNASYTGIADMIESRCQRESSVARPISRLEKVNIVQKRSMTLDLHVMGRLREYEEMGLKPNLMVSSRWDPDE